MCGAGCCVCGVWAVGCGGVCVCVVVVGIKKTRSTFVSGNRLGNSRTRLGNAGTRVASSGI